MGEKNGKVSVKARQRENGLSKRDHFEQAGPKKVVIKVSSQTGTMSRDVRGYITFWTKTTRRIKVSLLRNGRGEKTYALESQAIRHAAKNGLRNQGGQCKTIEL